MQSIDLDGILFDAVFGGDLSQVESLIKNGANKNAIYHKSRLDGASALSAAAIGGHLDIARYLVREGCSVNFIDPCQGRNPLHWACQAKQYQIVKFLLAEGVDVNIADKDHVTPLIQATDSRNVDIVKLLLENGADVNKRDITGRSALHCACIYGDRDVISELVISGCVLNNLCMFNNKTLLCYLVHENDLHNANLLLEAGYDWRKDTWLLNNIDIKYGQGNYLLANSTTATMNECFRACMDIISQPNSLTSICRTAIRKTLGGANLRSKVHDLPIPNRIKLILLFNQM